MQKSNSGTTRAHRKVGTSTTLNRRYVKRPQSGTDALEASVEAAAQKPVTKVKIQHFHDEAPVKSAHKIQIEDDADRKKAAEKVRAKQQAEQLADQQLLGGQALTPVALAQVHPLQQAALERMQSRRAAEFASAKNKQSAKQIKDQAIKKALATSAKAIDKDTAEKQRAAKRSKLHFGIARVMLAISCAAMAVLAIVYFVGTNMPDISMRVAALQTGISASYPGYIPRDFSLSNLSSEDGKVTLNFVNKDTGDAYNLVEENSSWDSTALLNNYVKPTLGDDYTILREQGLTIYVSDQGASWVNGGVVYKLNFESGHLTKKQITSIAVSL